VKENKSIEDSIKRLTEKIAVLKDQATQKGLAFNSLTPEQLEKKLRSTQTPFITATTWTSRGPAFSSFYFSININNPDPIAYFDLFAYFFFGPANMIADVGTALLSVDERLPKIYAQFPYISAGSSDGLVEFNYRFPSGIPLGLYMGNAERAVELTIARSRADYFKK
jgi:hypothetical protein